MTKAILLALTAIVGSGLGVLGFFVLDARFHVPFAVDELPMWAEYGALSFGGVGAVCGVVAGRVACGRKNKHPMHAPVPSENPPADAAVQSRRNIRPLTWLYRA